MSDGSGAATETRARSRTRRAILDAAVVVLAQTPAASLGDIADAAGVGRTTLHRYFPERADLLGALSLYVLERIDAAAERAQLDLGPAPDALDRLCREYFELGDVMMYVYSDPDQHQDPAWEECRPADSALLAMVKRGQAEGTIDPQVEPLWVQQSLWALLYAAWHYTRENAVPRQHALKLCLYSLRKIVGV